MSDCTLNANKGKSEIVLPNIVISSPLKYPFHGIDSKQNLSFICHMIITHQSTLDLSSFFLEDTLWMKKKCCKKYKKGKACNKCPKKMECNIAKLIQPISELN